MKVFYQSGFYVLLTKLGVTRIVNMLTWLTFSGLRPFFYAFPTEFEVCIVQCFSNSGARPPCNASGGGGGGNSSGFRHR